MIHTGRIQELRILRRSHDLLILGERHRRLVLGGPVRAVLAHAHCPVGLTD